jgi:hypothetical protein
MKKSVYLETSVISYLAANPSLDLIVAAHQKVTHDWWIYHRHKFDLFVSAAVEREISLGNAKLAKKRLDLIKPLSSIAISKEALKLAKTLIKEGPLPDKAELDALHISLATIHQIDYVLSWNCKHIANVFIQKDLAKLIRKNGFECPLICTPENMLELNK